MEATLQTGDYQTAEESQEVLRSVGLQEAIEKEDQKTVDDLLKEAAEAAATEEEMLEVIRARQPPGQWPKLPVRYIGDRSITVQDIYDEAPKDAKVYVYRDDFRKRYLIFYGRRDSEGHRWARSKAWGATGDESSACPTVCLGPAHKCDGAEVPDQGPLPEQGRQQRARCRGRGRG